jgi:hypothetical protein
LAPRNKKIDTKNVRLLSFNIMSVIDNIITIKVILLTNVDEISFAAYDTHAFKCEFIIDVMLWQNNPNSLLSYVLNYYSTIKYVMTSNI